MICTRTCLREKPMSLMKSIPRYIAFVEIDVMQRESITRSFR